MVSYIIYILFYYILSVLKNKTPSGILTDLKTKYYLLSYCWGGKIRNQKLINRWFKSVCQEVGLLARNKKLTSVFQDIKQRSRIVHVIECDCWLFSSLKIESTINKVKQFINTCQSNNYANNMLTGILYLYFYSLLTYIWNSVR